jgi:hypothetical protein
VNRAITAQHGFVASPAQSHGHNLATELATTFASIIINRPSNLACHNLCTYHTPPLNYCTLLGPRPQFELLPSA